MRTRPLALSLLALAACSEPPPPPPPPLTPAQRLEKSAERLRRLAEEQLAAAPKDARLQLWVAAFKGQDTFEGLASLPPSPLIAVVRASQRPGDTKAMRSAEDILPKSSHTALIRARWMLANANVTPDYWKRATDSVEEALRRDAWECPVLDFRRWALDWLEANEPDLLARVCYRPSARNDSWLAAVDLLNVARGMSLAAGTPRLDAPKVARAVRRLLEDVLKRSPDADAFKTAHATLPLALEAQFLLAWRLRDLETAKDASVAVEEFGRRDVAHRSWSPSRNSRLSLEDTILGLFKARTLKPPFPSGVSVGAAAEDMKESLKEVESGAKAYFAAWKADVGRSTPCSAAFEDKKPAKSPKTNYLGQALRDREFLFTDRYPKDAYERLLQAAFGFELESADAIGLQAYGWVIRDCLARPSTIPSNDLIRAFRDGMTLDRYAVLLARKEEAGARPALDKERLHGYTWTLYAVAKTKAAEAVEYLPSDASATPLAVAVAETLRAATEKDFGLEWPKWKATLKP
jgi:hypothetical protein